MDHSAFDAAAFEISSGDKTIIYTGDFRGHGRKAGRLDIFIDKAKIIKKNNYVLKTPPLAFLICNKLRNEVLK